MKTLDGYSIRILPDEREPTRRLVMLHLSVGAPAEGEGRTREVQEAEIAIEPEQAKHLSDHLLRAAAGLLGSRTG